MTLQNLYPEALQFLDCAVQILKRREELAGIAIAGSYVTGTMDKFSDIDLVIAVRDEEYVRAMEERQQIAASLGKLLAAFTGEHVGEPRLLICLYDEPLLHVDLKFVKVADFGERVEDPTVLWERDGQLSAQLGGEPARFPSPDEQWIEDRFWVWVHYGAGKIGRGEIFEAIEFLSFLRSNVLGPLALQRAGARAMGVRRLETLAPEFAEALKGTLARHEAADCARALGVAVELYRGLRGDVVQRVEAELAAVGYLEGVGG